MDKISTSVCAIGRIARTTSNSAYRIVFVFSV